MTCRRVTMLSRLGVALGSALMLVDALDPRTAIGAECVTLSPGNYEAYAPGGSIPRVFHGDTVLRNDRIVVAVADPALVTGRSASRWSIANVAGGVIALAQRGGSNGAFRAFYPAPPRFKPDAPAFATDFPDETQAARLPGREPLSGPRVVLRLPAYELDSGRSLDDLARQPAHLRGLPKPFVEVSYTLEDGWPYVQVQVSYVNPTDRPVPLNPDACLRLDGTPEARSDFGSRLFGACAEGSSQAWGVLAGEHKLAPAREAAHGFRLQVFAPNAQASVLAPQGTQRFAWRLFTGATWADVRTAAAAVLGVPLPAEPDAATAPSAAGVVVADITDAGGEPIPCKVQFRGRNGTSDPRLGPGAGAERVRNLRYTPTGRFRQDLPPGHYDAIVTCGPECDAVCMPVEAEAGRDTPLKAVLTRRVATPGWISAELHTHSDVSGPNELFYVYPYTRDPVVDGGSTASPLGRVLNLLCEQIEFAPATEHNVVYDYAPLVKALGAEGRLATCPGIGLTAGRRHTVNHQNAFPVAYRPGRQDGGAPQRPEHVGQLAWLKTWDGAADRLIALVQPRDAPIAPARNVVLDVRDIEPLVEGQPIAGRSRTILDWLIRLDEGYRLPAVVSDGALDTFHGSARHRTYVRSRTDDPRALDPRDVARELRAGHATLTTGPFLDVELASEGRALRAMPGDDLASPDGRVVARIRVQSSNWARIDRVQVLLNGRRSSERDFRRAAQPGAFADGVLAFNREVRLLLTNDAYLVVVASGRGPNLRQMADATDTDVVHVAVANPVWVDVGADGYRPHSPLDDRVDSTLTFAKPVLARRDADPGRVRLLLRNTGGDIASDTVSLEVVPADAARILGPVEQTYTVPPGGETPVEWELVLTEATLKRAFPVISTYNNTATFGVRVARSAQASGRKPASHWIEVDHPIVSLPALARVEDVPAALAPLTPYRLQADGQPLADLRFAVAGSNLAVWAAVTEPRLTRRDVPWEGSCVQVFGTMPGRSATNTGVYGNFHPVAEVDLLPRVDTNPPAAFFTLQTQPVRSPAPRVQMTSAEQPGGYGLASLIPLAQLGIDAAAGRFLLECRVSANGDGGPRRASLFRSTAPLTDSHAFARMRIE